MIPAAEAYRGIEATIAELRREEARVAERVQALVAEAAEVRKAQGEAHRALARTRLDALARDETTGRLDRAEAAALAALEASRAALEAAEAERAGLAGALEAAEAARAAAEARRSDAAARLEALAGRVEAALADDPGWIATAAEVAAAEATAAAADAKADQAEADRAEKTRAYDADPLFRYLWERRFGTGDYRAGSLVRMADAWVARLIGYGAARPDYHRLHEIPRRLRGHADRLAEAAAAARGVLEARRRGALEAAGAVPVEVEAVEAEAALATAEAEIDRLEAARGEVEARAAALSDPDRDAGLASALAGLAEAVAGADLAGLAAAARATPDPEDDRIVARLEALAGEAERGEAALREAEREGRALAARRADLEAERRQFRERGWSEPGGGFETNELLGELLKGIAAGALRSGRLGDVLSTGYRGPARPGGPRTGGRLPGSTGPAPRPPAPPRSPSRGGFRTGGGF